MCVNFASYDYLGLNGHPEITRAVGDATAEWGTSVSASRITAGERGFHRELEAALAEIYEIRGGAGVRQRPCHGDLDHRGAARPQGPDPA